MSAAGASAARTLPEKQAGCSEGDAVLGQALTFLRTTAARALPAARFSVPRVLSMGATEPKESVERFQGSRTLGGKKSDHYFHGPLTAIQCSNQELPVGLAVPGTLSPTEITNASMSQDSCCRDGKIFGMFLTTSNVR